MRLLKGRPGKISKEITKSGFLVDKFMEICAIIHPTKQFGKKRGTFLWLNS